MWVVSYCGMSPFKYVSCLIVWHVFFICELSYSVACVVFICELFDILACDLSYVSCLILWHVFFFHMWVVLYCAMCFLFFICELSYSVACVFSICELSYFVACVFFRNQYVSCLLLRHVFCHMWVAWYCGMFVFSYVSCLILQHDCNMCCFICELSYIVECFLFFFHMFFFHMWVVWYCGMCFSYVSCLIVWHVFCFFICQLSCIVACVFFSYELP